MTEATAFPIDRLQNALGDRYRLEGEIGAGGMATVLGHGVFAGRRPVIPTFRQGTLSE